MNFPEAAIPPQRLFFFLFSFFFLFCGVLVLILFFCSLSTYRWKVDRIYRIFPDRGERVYDSARILDVVVNNYTKVASTRGNWLAQILYLLVTHPRYKQAYV